MAKAARTGGTSKDQPAPVLSNHTPLARLGPLASAGAPIFHIHGDADKIAPIEANSAELARRYKAAGGKMEILVLPGKGHEVIPEYWQQPKRADFFLKEINPPQDP